MSETFSYSAFGNPWLDHERLAELIFAIFYNSGGVVALKLFKFLCAGLTISFIAVALAESGASIRIQTALIVAIALGLGPEIQFRPQLFTFICFASLMYLLARDNRRRSGLVLAIPLMCLWANLHGGFVIGLGALGLYFGVATLRSFFRGNRWRTDLLGYCVIFVLSCLVTFITPFGVTNWRAVMRTLGNPATHSLIQEWKPLLTLMIERLHTTPTAAALYAIVFCLMGATVIAFAVTPGWDDLPLVTIAVCLIAAALVSVRNIEPALIAIAEPLAYHLKLITEKGSTRIEDPVRNRSFIEQSVLCGVALAVLIGTGLFSCFLPATIDYPSGAIAFMRRNGITGNVMCDFNWGGYFLYHMPPRSRVFIDNRYDLAYPDRVIRDYLSIAAGKADTARVLNAYSHQFAMIPPTSPLSAFLMNDRDWRLIYEDRNAALFARTNEPAAKLRPLVVATASQAGVFP